MDLLEFKCGAALSCALGAESAVTSPFWVETDTSFPSPGADHVQAFLPCLEWGDCAWDVERRPGLSGTLSFGMARWQRGSTGRKQPWKADEGKLSPASQVLAIPS